MSHFTCSTSTPYRIDNVVIQAEGEVINDLKFHLIKKGVSTPYSVMEKVDECGFASIYKLVSDDGEKFKALKVNHSKKGEFTEIEFNKLLKLHTDNEGQRVKKVTGIIAAPKCHFTVTTATSQLFSCLLLSWYDGDLFLYNEKMMELQDLHFNDDPAPNLNLINAIDAATDEIKQQVPRIIEITRQLLCGLESAYTKKFSFMLDLKDENVLQRTKDGRDEFSICDVAGGVFFEEDWLREDRVDIYMKTRATVLRSEWNALPHRSRLKVEYLDFFHKIDVHALGLLILSKLEHRNIFMENGQSLFGLTEDSFVASVYDSSDWDIEEFDLPQNFVRALKGMLHPSWKHRFRASQALSVLNQ